MKILSNIAIAICSLALNSEAFADNYYNYWMTKSKMVQDSTLREITISGAHDAGMGKVTSCSDYGNDKVTQTQDKSFYNMLNLGVRYFDLRPIVKKNGDIYLGHFDWVGKTIDIGVHKFTLRNEGCFGYSVAEMLDDVYRFISTDAPNNKEVIILDFSHFMDFQSNDHKGSTFTDNDFARLEKMVSDKLGQYLIKSNKNLLDTKLNTLTKDGGKVIVIFEKDGYSGDNGIYSDNYLSLYNEYANKSNFEEMQADQFQKIDSYLEGNYNRLWWTLTMNEKQIIGCSIPDDSLGIKNKLGYNCTPIKKLASTANNNMINVLSHCIAVGKYPNILYEDYVSENQTTLAMVLTGNKHCAKQGNIEVTHGNYSNGAASSSWATCSGYKMIFQNDGNLVVYNMVGKPVWASGTENKGGTRLSWQNDGNLVIYNNQNKSLWASDTVGLQDAKLFIQQDGNVVIYKNERIPAWTTNTMAK